MNKLVVLFFCLAVGTLTAQQKLAVERCADIDRRVPILNIHIDENNNKWVADRQGLFLAQSPDFASTVDTDAADWALLGVKDGNQELTLPKAELEKLMGPDFEEITTAHVHQSSQELWIGTNGGGVYQFKFEPSLQLIGTLTKSNSKLRSDFITTLHTNYTNELVIGTDDGMLIKQGKKTEVAGKYFRIDAISDYEGAIWVVSEGEVLELDDKGRMLPLDGKDGMIDGAVVDIAFDTEGRIWVASEIVVRYNFESDYFDRFGPAQDFTSQYVETIAIDADDALWVGTKDKGVYFIGKASSMSATVVVAQQLGCDEDAKDAALQVRASGGQPPYTYNWSGGLQGDNPQNLGPGSYAVTITDQKGRGVKAEAEIADNRLIVKASEERPAGIGEANGKAALQVDGGKPGYAFQWDNGENTRVANKLAAGLHNVTISDKNGCSTVASIEITESLAPLTVELEQTKTSDCYGVAGATLLAAANGGQAPYQYQWSDGKLKGSEAIKVAAGTYSITVTDAANAIATANIEISQPAPLEATTELLQPATINNADGQVVIKAKGGTGNYTYRWDNGEETAKAEKLPGGKHQVIVTDENGCSVTLLVDVTEDILPLSVALELTEEIKCAGETTAAISSQVKGGKGPFTYQWTGGGNGESLSGLAAGTYELTVTDDAGTSTTAKIDVPAIEPLEVSLGIRAPASANQEDGRVRASMKGGSGSYSFQWSNGENKEIATKLGEGTHSVTVTDGNGCVATASIEMTEDVLPLKVKLVSEGVIACAGEAAVSLEAQVSGGKSPFTYQWTTEKGKEETATALTAGDYEVTVTDVLGGTANTKISITEPIALQVSIAPKAPASTNNADGQAIAKIEGGTGRYTYQWDNGETSLTAKQLAAGERSITVTDANGCTATASIEITENILPLTADLTSAGSIDCAGGETASVKLEVDGGKPPYNYQWNSDKVTGTETANLPAGTYQVTITDAAGNNQVQSVEISEPSAITASVQVESPASTNNADGKAIAQGNGGTGKYSFNWDNGETTAAATKLAPGTHIVTVTDENGCSVTAEVDISENVLPLTISLQQTANINCAGEKKAALEVTIQGGKSPFEYQWSSGDLSGATPTEVGAGSYSLTVTDASGLSQQANIEITEPEPLQAEMVKIIPATNEDAKDGKAEMKATGGRAPYSFQWDNGEGGRDAERLAFGAHTVTVEDTRGCFVSHDFEIGKKILPALTAGRLSEGQTLQVSNLYFDADSTNMTEASYPVLKEIAGFLEDNPLVAIEVGGHTNNIPEHEYCDQLSSERAKSVALYIVQQGIDPNRLVYKGYGKRVPKYSNRTEDGRRRNQRVEIKILRIE